MPSDASFLTHVAYLAKESPGVLARALRTGGRYADLFYENTVYHRVTWRQQAGRRAIARPTPEHSRQVVEGVGIRVLGDGMAGFAATDDGSLQATADAASAPWGGHGTARQPLPLTPPSIHLDLPADAPDAIALSEKIALTQAAADAACSLDDGVRHVAVSYHDRARRIAIATSEGVLRATASTLLGLRVAVTLRAQTGSVTAYAMTGGAQGFGYFFDHPPEYLAREAVERARRLLRARAPVEGTQPVVLAAGWGGVWLHEAVGHLLEADVVASGGSPFAGCRDRRVAASAVTLLDDATLPGGRGTGAFDDEGTPATRTLLIENGVLRGYLTDRRTAEALGLDTTGNARRQDYRHAPLPRMTNLLLQPGETDPADLIAEVDEGLYVQTVGQGRVRPDGVFAFDVLEGYRIERGRLTEPVTGARLVGTGPEVLRAVVGVGRDLQVDTARGLCKKAGQIVPVSVGMPTVLLQGLMVEAGGSAARAKSLQG